MRILIPFLFLLLASCSGNQNSESEETSSTKNEKEVASDTLPRLELTFKGEDQLFSIYEISEFDTSYRLYFTGDTPPCSGREVFVYTYKKLPKLEWVSLGGMKIDSTFEGILISFPTTKNGNCAIKPSEETLEEWKNSECEKIKLLPANKNKPCPYKAVRINNHDALYSEMGNINEILFSASLQIRFDSATVYLTGFWNKNNVQLKQKITRSLISFQ